MAAACPLAVLAQGQQGSGSPYSAYGFGELLGSTQVVRATMGGVGIATFDPYGVDASNPASYAGLNRPVFETGVALRNMQFSTSGVNSTGSRADFLGFSLGVPFNKGRSGLALGLAPVTEVGYLISNSEPLSSGEGDVRYEYSGDGGLNKAYFGLAQSIEGKRDSLGHGNRLSLGANLNYLFGRVDETRKAIYPTGGFYNTTAYNSLYVGDVMFTVGGQFQGDLVKRSSMESSGLRYMVGISAELGTELGAERTELVSSFYYGSTGVEIPYDTTQSIDGAKGSIGLPASIGIGAGVFNTHWNISIEHRRRDWTQLTREGDGIQQRGTLALQGITSLGASYRPAGDVGGTFWERSIYRMGLRYMQDYLVINETQLSEFGMSFGMSIPVMGSSTRSRITFGAELGERGTLADGLIKERFADVYIGISITPDIREQWFKKRRIE